MTEIDAKDQAVPDIWFEDKATPYRIDKVRSVNSKLITTSWNETLENIIQDFKNDIYDDVSVGPRLDCVFMYITEIMTKAHMPGHPASYWTDEECMLFMDVLTTHFVNELYGHK